MQSERALSEPSLHAPKQSCPCPTACFTLRGLVPSYTAVLCSTHVCASAIVPVMLVLLLVVRELTAITALDYEEATASTPLAECAVSLVNSIETRPAFEHER